MTKKLTFKIFYSATTQTVALGKALSNHNRFWKWKILKVFFANYAIIENSKHVLTYLTSQETALKFKHRTEFEKSVNGNLT